MRIKIVNRYFSFVLTTLILLLSLIGCSPNITDLPATATSPALQALETPAELTSPNRLETHKVTQTPDTGVKVEKGHRYSTKDEVAAYIHIFHELPPNFITKKEAQEIGWDNSKGNLWKVTDKMSIGGDVFGNREGILPKKAGRKYFECDINYNGGFRGSERIVYSNDGLVFYSDDHYETFEKLYQEEK